MEISENTKRHFPICGSNKELLKALTELGAKFIIVGSLGVHYYAPIRKVGDLDILIERTEDTANKVISVLNTCPLIQHNFTSEQFLRTKKTQVPVKIHFKADILIPGDEIDFYHHLEQSHDITIDDIKLKIASIDTLISLLSLSKEKKHIDDISLLRKIKANN